MQALKVFLLLVAFSPVRGEKDYGFRWYLAEAIASASDDEAVRDRLATIAWLESGFRRAVARCEIKGDGGKSLGVFQLKPIDRGDDKRACGDLPAQARLAKAYVERSAAACPGNVGAAALNVYTSGKCNGGVPLAASKNRWEPPAWVRMPVPALIRPASAFSPRGAPVGPFEPPEPPEPLSSRY